MFKLYKQLSQHGVLSINNRNANYTLKYNDRSKYPIVDDKLKTKHLAIEAGLPVPDLYTVIEFSHQIKRIHSLLERYESFAIKPASGSGGDGIMVITRRAKNLYRKASGDLLSHSDVDYHLSNILSGLYSLGGQMDKIIIEYCVQTDPIFDPVSYLGVPDIRIIVFFGVPVMSMIRLPTKASDGKANLHLGAIGAGVNIADGTTLSAVWKNAAIEDHPDTGNSVAGIQIPGWHDLLSFAAKCYELTGLAYLGVDIVLDKNSGPMILELNARPGLNIQIANQSGLLPRLRQVEQNHKNLDTINDRIQFAVDRFGV